MAVKLIALQELAKIYSGSTLKASSNVDISLETKGCPWVLVEDLCNEPIEQTSRMLSWKEMQAVRVAPSQTVLFSSTGTIGKVGMTSVPMAPSNNIIAVEFNTDVVFPLYGMYCLAAMRSDFIPLAKGAVYDSLRLTDFKKFLIPVPPLTEQKLIAEKLLAIQKAIYLQQGLISDMQASISAKFSVLFEKEINSVVVGEKSSSLDQCAEILFNGAAKQTGGVQARYVSTAILTDWEIPYEQIPTSEVAAATMTRFQLRAGDIVMNRINQFDRLGRCGIICAEPEVTTVFGQNTLRIRAHLQIVEPLFLFAWFKHAYIKQYIQSRAKSSTSFQSSLSKQVLSNLPVPIADLTLQQAFSKQFEKYMSYVSQANLMVAKLQALQQIWYNKILILRQSAQSVEPAKQTDYQYKQYWIAPTGTECFYDTFLECIQIPRKESHLLQFSQLPVNVDLQFVDEIRDAFNTNYGALSHIRLHKLDAQTVRRDWMQPEAYDSQDVDSSIQQQLEETGLFSDQQDFGFIRHSEELIVDGDESVASLLLTESPVKAAHYTRFPQLPMQAQQFIKRLSTFQQAIYEEFLLAMQPLACHMVQKQLRFRMNSNCFPSCGIQDVIATVQMLEHFGLLERKQGIQLDYFTGDAQDRKREPIQDYQGHAILVDTWTWLLPEGGSSL